MARVITKEITVNAATGYCDGHFPGHPVVPAAVELKWMTELARERGLWGDSGYSVKNLKLIRELVPGITVAVKLCEKTNGWVGTVSDSNGLFAQCRLVFKDE